MWKIVEEFVFWYPAVMAMMWVLGALVFYWSNERNKDGIIPENLPFVSILMPAHNESSILKQVVEQMVNLDYPDYEVILINDGSTDNSSEVMKELSEKYDRVRVVDLDKNCGKANALYLGLIASKGEILVGVDADPTDEEIDRYFELDPLVSQQMHHGKYIEVLHNPIPTGVGQGRKAYKEHKKKMAEERRRKTN